MTSAKPRRLRISVTLSLAAAVNRANGVRARQILTCFDVTIFVLPVVGESSFPVSACIVRRFSLTACSHREAWSLLAQLPAPPENSKSEESEDEFLLPSVEEPRSSDERLKSSFERQGAGARNGDCPALRPNVTLMSNEVNPAAFVDRDFFVFPRTHPGKNRRPRFSHGGCGIAQFFWRGPYVLAEKDGSLSHMDASAPRTRRPS